MEITAGQKIINLALPYTGKKDDPIYRDWFYGAPKPGVSPEVTKYNNWLELMKKAPDCCVFVCFICDKNGTCLGKGDFQHGYASVPNLLKHFTATGELTKNPKPGDLVIMGWDGKTPMHIGFYRGANTDGSDQTIEANTSNPAALSHSEENGGWTMQKNRQKKFIIAYVHPKVYDTPAA